MKDTRENSTIENLSKHNPFSVPEGYFEQFEERLMARIHEQENPVSKPVIFLRYLKPAIGMAASFLIIFMLMYIPSRIIAPKMGHETGQPIERNQELEFVDQINDFALWVFVNNTSEIEPLCDTTIENVLIASISDYELYGY